MSQCLENLAEALKVKANHVVRNEVLVGNLMARPSDLKLKKRIREGHDKMNDDLYFRGKGSKINRICFEIVTGEREMSYLVDDALKRLRQYDDIKSKIKEMKLNLEGLIAEEEISSDACIDLTQS